MYIFIAFFYRSLKFIKYTHTQKAILVDQKFKISPKAKWDYCLWDRQPLWWPLSDGL